MFGLSRRLSQDRLSLRMNYPALGAAPRSTERELQMGRSDVAVADARTSQYYEFPAITIRKRSIALFFLRLPVFVPIIFIMPGCVSLNANGTLTVNEASVLGTGGV